MLAQMSLHSQGRLPQRCVLCDLFACKVVKREDGNCLLEQHQYCLIGMHLRVVTANQMKRMANCLTCGMPIVS